MPAAFLTIVSSVTVVVPGVLWIAPHPPGRIRCAREKQREMVGRGEDLPFLGAKVLIRTFRGGERGTSTCIPHNRPDRPVVGRSRPDSKESAAGLFLQVGGAFSW